MRESLRPKTSPETKVEVVRAPAHFDEVLSIETALEERAFPWQAAVLGKVPAMMALAFGIHAGSAMAQERPEQKETDFSPEFARSVEKNFGASLREMLKDWRVTVPIVPQEAWGVVWHYKQTHASPTSGMGTLLGGREIDKSTGNIRTYLPRQIEHAKPICVFREGMMDNDEDRARVKGWKEHVKHSHVLHQRVLSTPINTLEDMDKLIERYRYILQISNAFALDSLKPVVQEVKTIVEQQVKRFDNFEERSDDSPGDKATRKLLQFKMITILMSDAVSAGAGFMKGGQSRHVGGALSVYLERDDFELCGIEDPDIHARTKVALNELTAARDSTRQRWMEIVDSVKNDPAYEAHFKEIDGLLRMKSAERTEEQSKRIEEIRSIIAPAVKVAEDADAEHQRRKTLEVEKENIFNDLALTKRNAKAMEKIARVSEPTWEFGGPISIAIEWGASHDLTPDIRQWNASAGNKVRFGYVTMEPR